MDTLIGYELWHRETDAPNVLVVQERFPGERTVEPDKDAAIAHAQHCSSKWPACRLILVELTNDSPGGYSSSATRRRIVWPQ